MYLNSERVVIWNEESQKRENSLGENVERRLHVKEHKVDREQRFLRKRSELDDVLEEVFDRITLMTVYDLMKKRLIKEFQGVVSAGKESRIYLAQDDENRDIAVKIYLVTSAEFRRNRQIYVAFDPRFKKIPTDFREFIHLWARREFSNLKQSSENGVPVPKPYFVEKNVLGMEFLGVDGKPFPTLTAAGLNSEECLGIYDETLTNIYNLYNKAELVHGDLSDFNIFVTDKLKPVFIDLSHAIHRKHPSAVEILTRDVTNIVKFFRRNRVKTKSVEEILDWLVADR